jgi:serine/threonine-protein kinase HipA
MSRPDLGVWLYGVRVATLHDGPQGRLTMQWQPEATRRWPVNSTVLSVLLPLVPSRPPHPLRVRAFFAGLMPEGDARVHLALEAGVEADDVFGMLAAYGRDVAGALVVQTHGQLPGDGPGQLRPMTPEGVRRRLELADSNVAPLGVVAGVTSLSLAGMQPKIALHRTPDGAWMECRDGAASTHIIKPGRPPGSATADLIHNEAYCLRLARRLGLTTVTADVEDFDGREALVVSRYDREVTVDGVRRIHQEDCAQMLGLNTDDPMRKFQYGRQMPSLKHIAGVLELEYASQEPLLALTTFNVAIGNTDAHAKNHSVLHLEDGTLTLAPAYDVSPHRHYEQSGGRSAMDVNGMFGIDALRVDDLVGEAVAWRLPRPAAGKVVQATLEGLQAGLEETPPATPLSGRAHEVMICRVKRLLEGHSAGGR